MTRPQRLAAAFSLVAVATLAVLVSTNFHRILEHFALIDLASEDAATRERAAKRLGDLRSARAAPRLFELFREKKLNAVITQETLATIGDRAKSTILSALGSPERDVRRVATHAALAASPQRLEPFRAAFLELLSDQPEDGVKLLADNIALEPEVSAALVGAATESCDWEFQKWTGQLGPLAAGTIPHYLKALRNRDTGHGYGAIALAKVAVLEPERVLKPLVQYLEDSTKDINRQRAWKALRVLGPGARPAWSELLPEYRKETTRTSVALQAMLAALNGDSNPPPDLWTLLDPSDAADVVTQRIFADIGNEGARAIANFGTKLLPEIRRRLNGELGAGQRRTLLATLSHLGSRAVPALPEIIASLDSPESELAQQALEGLGPKALPAASEWFRMMETKPGDAHRARSVGPDCVANARGYLKREDERVVKFGLSLILHFGPLAYEALPDLESLLNREHLSPTVELKLLHALRTIGSQASALVPLVALRLESGDARFRQIAAETILHIDDRSTIELDRLWPHLGKRTKNAEEILWIDRYPDVELGLERLRKMLVDSNERELAIQYLIRRPKLTMKLRDELYPDTKEFSTRSASASLVVRRLPKLRRLHVSRLVRDLPRAQNSMAWEYDYSLSSLIRQGTDRKVLEPILQAGLKHLRTLSVRVEAKKWLWRHSAIDRDDLLSTLVKALRAHIKREERWFGSHYEQIFDPHFICETIDTVAGLAPSARELVPELRRLLRDEDSRIRFHAIVALYRIDGNAPWKDVETQLDYAIRDRRQVQASLAWLVRDLGDKALPLVLSKLDDADEQVRRQALLSIKNSSDPRVNTAIVARLADEHFEIRQSAADILADRDLNSAEIDRALEHLRSDDLWTRRNAAGVISKLCELNETLLAKSLPAILADETWPPRARAEALRILALHRHRTSDLLERHAELLSSSETALRAAAIEYFARNEDEARSRLVQIIADHMSSSLKLRSAAIALRSHTPLNSEEFDVLSKLWTHADDRVKATAAETARVIAPDARPVVPILRQLLNSENNEARVIALRSLAELGTTATTVVQSGEIKELLTAGDSQVQVLATRVVARCGRGPHPPPESLLELLDDPAPEVQLEALRSLRFFGTPPKEILERIIAELENPDQEIRLAAMKDIGRAGTAATSALPQLFRVLEDDPNSQLRGLAARAIGQIGLERNTDCIRLAVVCLDRDRDVSLEVVKAVENLGIRALPCTPSLLRLLKKSLPRGEAVRIAQRILTGLGGDVVDRLTEELEAAPEAYAIHLLPILRDIGPAAKSALYTIRTYKPVNRRTRKLIEEAVHAIDEYPFERDR
ncbi:MAG: HEAT repeat domain-containing protein [Planctomycetota bacterium]